MKHIGLFFLALLGIGYSWKQVVAYRLAVVIPSVIVWLVMQ